jgi:hypothetical protein
VRLHDPVVQHVGKKQMTFRVHYARSSTAPIVPRVGDEVDIGSASYANASKARREANRARIVTRVAHYFERGPDGYVDHVDVYTDWRPINN